MKVIQQRTSRLMLLLSRIILPEESERSTMADDQRQSVIQHWTIRVIRRFRKIARLAC